MATQQIRFTTQALVIKEMNVGESDRLVTLLTKDFGIIKAFAAGAKNIKSKKAAATSLLTYSSVTFVEKKGTKRIYEATPISQFFTLGTEIEVLALSQYFCELAFVFGEENSPNEELLRLILNSLHFLTKEKKFPPLIKAITELRLASLAGYTPNLIACSSCGKFEDDIMYFDLSDGSLSCEACKENGTFCAIDKTMLSTMRHIVYSEFKKLYSFTVPDESANHLSRLTEKYITMQTDYKFQTLEFYRGLLKE